MLKCLNNLLAHHLEALSTGRSVTHDRQAATVGSLPQGLQHTVAHDRVAVSEALRLPRGGAAHLTNIVGDAVLHAGTLAQADERLGCVDRVVLTVAVHAAEHGVHAGGEEHNLSGCVLVRLTCRAADRQALLVGRHHVITHDLTGNVGGTVHHGERQLLRHSQGLTGNLIHDAPLLCGDLPAGSGQLVLVLRTQAANQVTGVDVHGATGLAHAVHSTGLNAVVLVLLTQALSELVIAVRLSGGNFTAHHDALARGQGQVAGGADRLAVAALHAAVDFFLDGFGDLQVGHVVGVRLGNQHAGVHEALRVDEALDLAHHVEEFVTELAAHERRHDTAGTVLSLQRAFVTENQLNHFFGEVAVAVQLLRVAELLVQHEVDVAVLRVTENHGVLVAVCVEQLGQVATGVAQNLDGYDHVFEQCVRAGGAVTRDGGVQTTAGSPQSVTLRQLAGHRHRRSHRQALKHGRCCCGKVAQLLLGVALELNQQGGVILHVDGGERLRSLTGTLSHTNTGGVHQLDGSELVSNQFRHGTCSINEVVEHEQTGRGVLQDWQGAVGCRSNEAEGTLRTNQQVLQNIDGGFEVDQGVQAVTHGVLHGVLLANLRHGLGVLEHALAQAQQTLVDFGFEGAQLLVSVRLGGVNDGAAGEHEHHGVQGVVGVVCGTRRHAGGVVRNHTTDGAGGPGRRVGAELVAVGRQVVVDHHDGRAGLHTHLLAVFKDLNLLEMAAGVDHQAVAARLAGEGGAAGAEGQRQAEVAGCAEDVGDVFGGVGADEACGHEQVVGCVVGDCQALQLGDARFDGFCACIGE